jgi:DNA-binding NarL/FixJ family response regulator
LQLPQRFQLTQSPPSGSTTSAAWTASWKCSVSWRGRTNLKIARELIVAPGTVKAHAVSIYRKLDVANRTEAVARARQLGILV